MSVDASDVWISRNRHWGGLSTAERIAFVEGCLAAYRDVFNLFREVFEAEGSLDDVFDAVRDSYGVEHDRAVVAGILP